MVNNEADADSSVPLLDEELGDQGEEIEEMIRTYRPKKQTDGRSGLFTRRRLIFLSFVALFFTLLSIFYVTFFTLPTFAAGPTERNRQSSLTKEDDKITVGYSPKQKMSHVRQGLVAKGKFFTLNGDKIQILSGSMHYFRIPQEYWFDRLTKLKAAGFNTVETYVAWNLHEEAKNQFDFSGNLDIVRYIQMADELGLYVIVRPGPYICAEWEWGGFPAWLLEDPHMKVRSTYKGYTQAVESYFEKLLSRLVPLQYTKGGPIIAVQIENEYGSYDEDKVYLTWCKKILESNGITELLFTSDGQTTEYLERGSVPGVLSVVNFQKDANEALDVLSKFQPDRPLMVGEFWTGWFDHWGEKHHVLNLANLTETLEIILARGASVNFYMFHGGTNFGFMNGANLNRKGDNLLNPTPPYLPTVTSYDYDAPLTESGQITPKYLKTQEILKKYNPNFNLTPELKSFIESKTPVTKNYGTLNCQKKLTLVEILNVLKPLGVVDKPTNVENLCQQMTGSCASPLYGFVVYRFKGNFLKWQNLTVKGIVRDRMQMILDGKQLTTIYSKNDNLVFSSEILLKENGSDLILLVENMGRVNYDKAPNKLDNQRKGFMGSVLLNGVDINHWMVYDLSLKPSSMELLCTKGVWTPCDEKSASNQPSFYQFNFDIDDEPTADTFVNFETWNKGVIFANNKNLGRFWKTGPQKTLYLPATYLKNKNEVILFELHEPQTKIVLQDKPELGDLCVVPCENNQI